VDTVSKSDDPERLLAEALRAQAVSTPVTMPPLPAVLMEAAGEPKPATTPEPVAEDEPADDKATDKEATDDGAAGEEHEPDTFTTAKAVTADDALAEPPARPSDTPFTEEMVLRELSSGPMTGELATIRINNAQQHYDTERFSPLENLYGPVGGPGFGLISGTEVGSTAGPPVGEFDHLPPEPVTRAVPTTRMPAERGQVPGWLILLFALVLGLAGGAVAGVLSML
jgi:hypothetical protein